MKLNSTSVIDGSTKTIFVWMDSDDVDAIEKEITKLLNRGAKRIDQDGTQTFVHYVPVVDTSKEGSAQYKWSKDGNRCLHNRVVCRLVKGKAVERTVTSQSYRLFD